MVLYSTSETATASHLSALLPAPAPARPAVTLCRTPVHAQRYPQRAHTTCSGGATASTARSKHSKLLVPAAMQCLQHLQLTSAALFSFESTRTLKSLMGKNPCRDCNCCSSDRRSAHQTSICLHLHSLLQLNHLWCSPVDHHPKIPAMTSSVGSGQLTS